MTTRTLSWSLLLFITASSFVTDSFSFSTRLNLSNVNQRPSTFYFGRTTSTSRFFHIQPSSIYLYLRSNVKDTDSSQTTDPFKPLFQWTQSWFGTLSTDRKDTELMQKRNKLKEELLIECSASAPNQKKTPQQKRKRIEELLKELSMIRPISNTASSPLLDRTWLLVWTTEKEINFFQDWKLSSQITQTIRPSSSSSSSQDGFEPKNLLSNAIEFPNGRGGLFVTGILSKIPFTTDTRNDPLDSKDKTSTNQATVRTYFEFQTATLDLAKWGKVSFPPVGKGWFDTMYLDEDLRCDINSRNDILICTPL